MDELEALNRLVGVANLPRLSDYMNLSTVRGFIGELLVKKRLREEGYPHVEHLGKAKAVDLRFSVNEKQITIDVKTSMLKAEFGRRAKNWGWALTRGEKTPAVTHFVCIALSENLGVERLFVISANNYRLFPAGAGLFRSVAHAFVLLSDGEPNMGNRNLLELSNRLLERGVVREVQDGQSLYEELLTPA